MNALCMDPDSSYPYKLTWKRSQVLYTADLRNKTDSLMRILSLATLSSYFCSLFYAVQVFADWEIKWAPFALSLLMFLRVFLATTEQAKRPNWWLILVANLVGNEIYRRCWHIAQMVAGLIFAKVQCSQDQCPGSSMFLLGPIDLDVEPLPLPALALLLPPPKLFELAILLHAPWESTSDRPFSKARTKFSK